MTGLFVYGNSYDDVYRYERHLVFPKILAQNCPEDFSHENTIYNSNPQKAGTARRHFASALSPVSTVGRKHNCYSNYCWNYSSSSSCKSSNNNSNSMQNSKGTDSFSNNQNSLNSSSNWNKHSCRKKRGAD